MTAKETIYHIYAKDRCLFHSLKEEEFHITWKSLQQLIELVNSDYDLEDLSYEEVTLNKEIPLNSSY